MTELLLKLISSPDLLLMFSLVVSAITTIVLWLGYRWWLYKVNSD